MRNERTGRLVWRIYPVGFDVLLLVFIPVLVRLVFLFGVQDLSYQREVLFMRDD